MVYIQESANSLTRLPKRTVDGRLVAHHIDHPDGNILSTAATLCPWCLEVAQQICTHQLYQGFDLPGCQQPSAFQQPSNFQQPVGFQHPSGSRQLGGFQVESATQLVGDFEQPCLPQQNGGLQQYVPLSVGNGKQQTANDYPASVPMQSHPQHLYGAFTTEANLVPDDSDFTALLPRTLEQWHDPNIQKAFYDFTSWYMNNPGCIVLPPAAMHYIRLLAPRGKRLIDMCTVLISKRAPLPTGYASLEIEWQAQQQIAILQAMLNEAVAHN
ncbi:hypothetical protein CC85DRAFT_330080 [Cutaneotrichosporon oleaginosum]|uniref:Uncharacterized protein n=1 Tax=Cutaneotrichosporon oleaginosum TaxID=879819 RepID=A0A0J0XGH0_9TREE|nr:uncharacterized protein CC85DRAFT_330080 [Cutaneotrichosporon oleaginosum]KLT40200.1 hypothetical protein CC85DRAFT_330080 [Cutaneotrichosporon oleaginosum]TXT10509.1 hypothetical protein COLE_04443 [Cutaneotrichosporon oleaginosum]